MRSTIKQIILFSLLISLISLSNICDGSELNGQEIYLKDDFHIRISPYNYENYLLCEVQLWSDKNKEPFPSNHKDGDTDIAYIYRPPFSSLGERTEARWLKVVNKWKKNYNGQFRSNPHSGSYFYKISYSQVPGKPEGFPMNKTIEFKVDFDEDEEFAKGIFLNKKYALKWAERMIKILNGNAR